jgi:circadian clock protein KaiB
MPRKKKNSGTETWKFQLFVIGSSDNSVRALANLKKFCDEFLAGHCNIEVIDLIKTPREAKTEQIVAIPTLVRTLPLPRRKMVGDLFDTGKVLEVMGIVFEK